MLTVCTVAVHAQNWRDVTDNYVTNPSFDGSANGWVINYNGSTAQNYGYQPMNYRYYDNETMELVYISNFAESWRDKNNGRGLLGNGSIHQALNNIPSGHYRLEADLIATDQSNRNNPVSGFFLFIADEEKESTTAVATNDNQPRHFSVEMETTQNSITIGAKTVNPNGNWLAMDNIKLYWYGEEVVATGLTLNPKTKSLTIGESFVLTAILTPENATFKRLKWSSDDEAIASVDENGVVTAHAAGVTTIRCATVNNARDLATTCRVTVERSNATADQLVINEIQVSNVDMFMDPSFNYGDIQSLGQERFG